MKLIPISHAMLEKTRPQRLIQGKRRREISYHYDEDCQRRQHSFRSDQANEPKPGGDPFAATELQPYWKHVANHSEQRPQRQVAREGKSVTMWSATTYGQCHRGSSFQRIQQQGHDPEHWRLAGDIGRADISAAALAHIFAAENVAPADSRKESIPADSLILR